MLRITRADEGKVSPRSFRDISHCSSSFPPYCHSDGSRAGDERIPSPPLFCRRRRAAVLLPFAQRRCACAPRPPGFAARRPQMVQPGERARPARLRRSSPTAGPAPPFPTRGLPCTTARRSRPASGDCCSPPVASLLLAHGQSGAAASCPWPALRFSSSLASGQVAAVAPRPRLGAPRPWLVRRRRCLPCALTPRSRPARRRP